MNRTGLALSAMIAIIGTAKILFPDYISPLFSLDPIAALFAISTAVIAYGVWFGPLRFLSGSIVLGVIGFTSILFAAGSIMSPTILGIRSSFIPIADIFMIMESGIVLSMIGLEKKRNPVLSPLLVVSLVWQVMQRRLHRPQATLPVSQS